jgi:hypothetical protein
MVAAGEEKSLGVNRHRCGTWLTPGPDFTIQSISTEFVDKLIKFGIKFGFGLVQILPIHKKKTRRNWPVPVLENLLIWLVFFYQF